jgi:hypothetical protein
MEWAEFIFTYDEIEAEIVQDILEAEDIEVCVRSRKVSQFPVNVCSMGEIRLFVKQNDLKKARKILKIMSDTK